MIIGKIESLGDYRRREGGCFTWYHFGGSAIATMEGLEMFSSHSSQDTACYDVAAHGTLYMNCSFYTQIVFKLHNPSLHVNRRRVHKYDSRVPAV